MLIKAGFPDAERLTDSDRKLQVQEYSYCLAHVYCIRTYTYTYIIYIYICMYVCNVMYVCMYVMYGWMDACMHVCMHACMYDFLQLCIYIY